MIEVRAATPSEYVTVRSICNAALLEVNPGLCRLSSVLVAEEEGRILGGLILHGSKIEAVAVRPGRRGQGIGTKLLDAAARRRPYLSAGFARGVRDFYERLGFEVRIEDGRCRGDYVSGQ